MCVAMLAKKSSNLLTIAINTACKASPVIGSSQLCSYVAVFTYKSLVCICYFIVIIMWNYINIKYFT